MKVKDWRNLGDALYFLSRAAHSFLRIDSTSNPWAQEAYDRCCKAIADYKDHYIYDETN